MRISHYLRLLDLFYQAGYFLLKKKLHCYEFTWLSKNLKLRLKQISFVDLVFFSSEK